MAAGSRSDSDAGEVEKLHRIAEERFLAGDVAGSLRVARKAEARCGSLTGFHALAAYEVHAAAAVRNWYGVLGVGSRGRVTHEDIKRRYRRLCLVLHPDKNRSAAADGAFKLLQEAWTVLSARHPPQKPRAAPSSTTTGARRPRSPASGAEKHGNHSPPPPAASDTFNSRKPREGAPPPRTFRSVYCGHCEREFYAADDDGKEEEYCVQCGERLSDPRRPTAAGTETLRHRRREKGSFLWPGQCPRCGERDAYKPCMVSVLVWQLRCVSCQHQGPQKSRSHLY
uniref:J domain-containing protein n=1 Tax=Hordeum vulgare subsp. vulgare TaxID=112509 RepID=A0A8I6Y4L5_HORVV